ncbi:hypothetical protein COV11_00480 [Candidatus Woesearchaeota archaeon CG10_big_fil_rev_8_21_14_0_10_30_7]|nr:MAG: hypothetical protein COV11_00480 [Candidatus Woesearchaeota archaeon CG10_big_fil_rev_8_21_14_0_10_30_7]
MRDKKKVFASLFIAFIMIFSIFGFLLGYSLNDLEVVYKNYKFVETPQGWLSVIDGERFFFIYTPEIVEDLLADDVKNVLNNANKITITQDPSKFYTPVITDFVLELSENIPKIKNVEFDFGLINNSKYNLPKITCENASTENIVLFFNESETETNSSITFNNNCVSVNYADQVELYQQKEAIYFALLGVI